MTDDDVVMVRAYIDAVVRDYAKVAAKESGVTWHRFVEAALMRECARVSAARAKEKIDAREEEPTR